MIVKFEIEVNDDVYEKLWNGLTDELNLEEIFKGKKAIVKDITRKRVPLYSTGMMPVAFEKTKEGECNLLIIN